jgi:hypothetical protein
MGPIGITIVVVIVAVFAVAIWMDWKRRRLHDHKSSGWMGRDSRQTRLDAKAKGSEWGAGT